MPLITMPREMGSLGKDVASAVAARIGKSVVHHEITEQLANKMRLRKSHVMRFLDGTAGIFEKLTTDQTSLSIFTADEVFRMVSEDNVAVIRGWGVTHLLGSVPHVIRVRVCAPFDLRVKHMMERLNTTDQALVEKEIRLSDEALTAITRRHYDIDWKDAEHYDLVLNTERVSVEDCVNEVMTLMNTPRFRETDESRQTLRDLGIVASVRAALRQDDRTKKLDVTISSNHNQITLSGMAGDAAESEQAAQIAAAVHGVSGVDNQLKTTTRAHRRFDS